MPRQQDQFDAFIAGIENPASIDDLATRFKRAGLLTDRLLAELVDAGLKARLRRAVNRDRLENGLPRLAAVPDHDADGHQLWLYKPHDALDVGDYVELYRRARSRLRRAEEYEWALQREFKAKFPDQPTLKQLSLTWGHDDKSNGGTEGAA